MTMKEFLKNQRKKGVLFFLAGFFLGGILYYMCQEPMKQLLETMKQDMALWASEEQNFLQAYLFVIWERGKVLFIVWLAGFTKIYKAFCGAFLSFCGMQTGFLLLFFFSLYGTKGVLLWLSSGVPQLFVYIPLYLFSFYRIFERRREKNMPSLLFVFVFFLFGCFLEAKFNVPLVKFVHSLVT